MFSSTRYTLYACERRDGYEKLYRATDRDSLMRLRTNEEEASGLKKHEIGRARGRDCSRLINARVSLTSVRQKSSVARWLPIESPRHDGESWVRENNFLHVGYTLSFLLLSNDASVVPRPEREERRLTCVNLLERFLTISSPHPRDSPPRREVSVYTHVSRGPVHAGDACRLLNMIMRVRIADAKRAFRWSKNSSRQ